MGLSSSKQKQTNGPSAFSQPYITQGAQALGSAFQSAQPTLTQAQTTLGAALPGLADRAFTAAPGVTAATGYNTDVLSGKYLDEGNPYLQGQIDTTNADVRARVAAAFTGAGRTGSGANVNALGRALAANETNLRYTDYANERSRMDAAAGRAPALEAAQYQGLGAYLQALSAATGLPLDAARAYSGGIGSLVGGYNTTTTTANQGLGSLLGGVAGAGLAGWASGGFKGI